MRRGEDVHIHETAIFTRPELVRFGGHVAVGAFLYCAVDLSVGDYVHIAPHCTVIGGKDGRFVMEDFSVMGAGSKIVCASDEFYGTGMIGPTIPKEYQSDHYGEQVKFEKHSGTGVGVTVLPDVTIGEGSMVGANSVVTRNLEPWGIYLGNKRIADRNRETILRYEEELRFKEDMNRGYPAR